MKNVHRLFAVTLLGISGLAASGTVFAQIEMPNPQLPGASMESAVRLIVTNDMMLDRQISRWIRTHYPGWDADQHDIQEFGEERYAVVYISHHDHPSRRVYFRLLKSHADPDNDGGAFPL